MMRARHGFSIADLASGRLALPAPDTKAVRAPDGEAATGHLRIEDGDAYDDEDDDAMSVE